AVTGDGKLVARGGYSRAYDAAYTNLPLNIARSFPLVLAYTVPTDATGLIPNPLSVINSIPPGNPPPIANPKIRVRTNVPKDFRAPLSEQFSLQLQRELTNHIGLTLGYVGTKGTGLYQPIDGNPTVPTPPGTPRSTRADPNRGVIRERCNCTSSTYHS